jgi:hypothetical protein
VDFAIGAEDSRGLESPSSVFAGCPWLIRAVEDEALVDFALEVDIVSSEHDSTLTRRVHGDGEVVGVGEIGVGLSARALRQDATDDDDDLSSLNA